ncbi:uncharacterized protein LOC116264860 [Nymphaea colorata]|nr:uncharacterized protein LOC116264860 [Nymphaea colorata]
MALVTHNAQHSFPTSTSRSSLPCSKAVKIKPSLALRLVGRINQNNQSKHRLLFSVGNRPILLSSRKPFRVSSFKGNPSNDEPDIRTDDSRSSNSSVQLSYATQQKEEASAGSHDKQRIFSKWLLMLWSSSPVEQVDEIVNERPHESESDTVKHDHLQTAAVKLLNAILRAFLGLDLAIKLPLVIFVPFYLAVSAIYGGEVVKDLTPLWTLGPAIVFLYVKLVEGLCSLYVFTFKQAILLLKRAPGFLLWLYSYIKEGKLKAKMRETFWQPVVDIKNLDYRSLVNSKIKELEVWMVEQYLDFVESIWPYYCRTIRFLKRANLI